MIATIESRLMEAHMNAKTLLKSAALGAGLCIFAVGLALAQTAPAPAAPQTNMRDIAQSCRSEVKADLRGQERREAMRKCVEEKREKAGLNKREDRRAEREKRRETHKANMKACRDELKDQRFTEAERRTAMEGCVAKKDPAFGKHLECRKQADEKKLERGSKEFRQHMQACNKG